MKKLTYLQSLFCFIAVCLTACYEDEGNYNYLSEEETGVIKIDTIGMANRYALSSMNLGDRIEMAPNVSYSNMNNLRYRWLAVPLEDYQYKPVQVGNALVYPSADTISHDKKLDWIVDLEPGQYNFYYLVEDTIKGLKAYFNFNYGSINTAGTLGGLYMLAEYNGETDIDVYTSNLMLIFGGDAQYPRYYSETTGRTIPGKPRFIRGSHTGKTSRDGYLVATDQTMLRLNTVALETMDTWNDMFYEVPTVFNPQYAYFTNNADFLVNDGKLHVLYTNQTNDRKFSSPIAGDYEAYTFLAHQTKTSWGAVEGAINADQIIYDTKNQRFRPYFPYGTSISNFNSTNGDAWINANNIPSDPVAIFNGYSGQTYCIIVEDNVHYLYRFNFYNRVDNGDLSADGQRSKIDLSACTGIAQATIFAANNAGTAFYYATDNGVYSFSPSSGESTSNLIYTCEPTEVVTAMYTWNSSGFPTAGALLWVALWDNSKQEGKLLEYEIDNNAGVPRWDYGNSFAPEHANPYVTTGWGKIVSMTCISTE